MKDNDLFDQVSVMKRSGALVRFEPEKIKTAITSAFLAVKGPLVQSEMVRATIQTLTETVVAMLLHRQPAQGATLHIEDIQDAVELALMRSGEHDVARAYVLYREEHAKMRAATQPQPVAPELFVTTALGDLKPLDRHYYQVLVEAACAGLDVPPAPVVEEGLKTLYNGVHEEEMLRYLVLMNKPLSQLTFLALIKVSDGILPVFPPVTRFAASSNSVSSGAE